MKKQFWDHSSKPSVFVEITDGVETYRGPFSGAMHNTEMDDSTIIDNLRQYNEWRRGENDEQPHPKNIGVWIDEICKRVNDQKERIKELWESVKKLNALHDEAFARLTIAEEERDRAKIALNDQCRGNNRLHEVNKNLLAEVIQARRERDEAREERDDARAKLEIIKPNQNNSIAEFFSSSNTPETDKFKIKFKSPCGEKYWVPVEHSERLERERDEARAALDEIEKYGTEEINAAIKLRQKLADARIERDEAREECNQQARLLGIGAERELALRGKIFELERKIQQLEAK